MRLKRIFSAAMAALTLVSLSACGGTTDTNKGMSDVTVEQTEFTGSGLVDTVNTIKKLEPDATVTEGLAIYQTEVVNAGSAVAKWLNKVGIK